MTHDGDDDDTDVESWYLFAPKYEMNDEEEWEGRMDSG